jgi:hypothetical protein
MTPTVILRHADGREQLLRPGTFAGSFIARWWLTNDRAIRGFVALDDVLRDMDCVSSTDPEPDRNEPRMLGEAPGYEFAK